MKKTKIVATISDLRCSVEFLRPLIEAGVNVVRMNTAHMTKEGITEVINNTRAVSPDVAVLLDTKGPEVRTTTLEGDPELKREFKAGDKVIFMANPEGKTNNELINVNYVNFVHDVPVGARILLDDGALEFHVDDKQGDKLLTTCQNNGKLGSRKSVNVPGVRIDLPSLTEKDRGNILHSIPQNIDFIAHSFVRNRQDILDIQEILDAHNSDIKIIAKIENQEGVDNIDEIIEVAGGIMIARGDLAIEVPAEKVPSIQRMIIKKCIAAKKPVIVATQMLHTMIDNPLPTRAEVSDIANAVYYRTDAVMLSGETANGKYPLEAVQTMARIISEAEATLQSNYDDEVPHSNEVSTTTAFLAKQAVRSVDKIDTEVIITDSFTGRTARYLSSFRATVPVCAVCYNETLARQLALSYGVHAHFAEETTCEKARLVSGIKYFINKGLITEKSQAAYMSGTIGHTGAAHCLEIETVDMLIEKNS
ncbi:pyruvate kinase [Porphyromonas sp. COT-239 OH1446]|uniref:pyruvate kinase n=1 Tax=Porphyromonas sp. COT-239 OH1446 TaxID=1515613 RepID=UPI00052BCD68|nr:pyruvate kinase [Porphyromonas sp. COT-239 OH1446]KGN71458.1 pyruvate kinase [Porphyromonas sp. COT-239 OH1446]